MTWELLILCSNIQRTNNAGHDKKTKRGIPKSFLMVLWDATTSGKSGIHKLVDLTRERLAPY